MTTKTPAQILSATLAEILASWDESLYERDERGQLAPTGGGDSGGEKLTPEQNREKWRQQDEEPDDMKSIAATLADRLAEGRPFGPGRKP